MVAELKPIEQLLKELSPESQAEVREFIESLANKSHQESNGHLRQTWAGALADYRDKFTSLELQKKSMEWRVE